MKLIVGLGNPGAQYERTRHNAGFMALDLLANKHASGQIPKSRFHAVTLDANIGGEKVLLMKPTTYMNRSGQSVGEAIRFFKLDPVDDLIVIVDDIALPVGHLRIRQSGSAAGHNGLADIDRMLGGADYPRIRIGVGSVPKFMNQSDWVLSKFMKEEHADIERGVKNSVAGTECVLEKGVMKAMNAFNTKLVKAKPAKKKPSVSKPKKIDESKVHSKPVHSKPDNSNSDQSKSDKSAQQSTSEPSASSPVSSETTNTNTENTSADNR